MQSCDLYKYLDLNFAGISVLIVADIKISMGSGEGG